MDLVRFPMPVMLREVRVLPKDVRGNIDMVGYVREECNSGEGEIYSLFKRSTCMYYYWLVVVYSSYL